MLLEIYESLWKQFLISQAILSKGSTVLDGIPIRHRRNPKGFPSATFEHFSGLQLSF